MNNRERIEKGLIYDPNDKEIMAEQCDCLELLYDFNSTRPHESELRARLLKEMFAEVGEGCYIEPPLYANWGGKNVHFGNNVYANFGLTLVDDADIYIGNGTLIAPHVTVDTGTHPILPELRKRGLQYNRSVHIGNNVWIGAGSCILPGVHIGDGSVIGAGSVVTKDIPENVVAVGVPCRVVREINEHDREYYFNDEKIDWENLEP